MKVSAINSIKIRGGYGITGQQDIGVSYPSIPLYLISNSTANTIWKYIFVHRPQPYNSNLRGRTTLNLVLITDCLIIELQVVLTCTKEILKIYCSHKTFFLWI
jgi:iron complex outermembrane receptor protein